MVLSVLVDIPEIGGVERLTPQARRPTSAEQATTMRGYAAILGFGLRVESTHGRVKERKLRAILSKKRAAKPSERVPAPFLQQRTVVEVRPSPVTLVG